LIRKIVTGTFRLPDVIEKSVLKVLFVLGHFYIAPFVAWSPPFPGGLSAGPLWGVFGGISTPDTGTCGKLPQERQNAGFRSAIRTSVSMRPMIIASRGSVLPDR
jgi:hypothetical protein